MINVQLLKTICEIPGAPGFENRIRDFVTSQLKAMNIPFSIDNMGNVLATVAGKSDKKLMVAAHMDEIGFIVNHIDDKGFLKFIPLGGFDPKTLTAQRVIVHGTKDIIGVMGSKPIHIMSPEEKNKAPLISDYFIDLGLPKEEVEKIVSIGSSVTRQRELIEMGNCVNCKSIDNRVAVFILLETLRQLDNNINCTFVGTFTVQEEVGLRGASVAAHHVEPDYALAIDTTVAFDTPGARPHEMVTELGKGAAIKIMDSGTICDTRMVSFLKNTASSLNLPYQLEILPAGGTDTAPLQRNGKSGAIAGAISIPTRHIHQVIEMADKGDIDACISLLLGATKSIHLHDWTKWN